MTSTAVAGIDDLLGALPAVDLDQLNGTAALQTRIDRKYVVPAARLEELAVALAASAGEVLRILDVDGRRSFSYESVYFDTPELVSYHGAARRRPQRFKVRTRSYLATEQCWIEVKLRDPHGRTVKLRSEHPFAERHRLTDRSLEFVASHAIVAPHAHVLEPVLTTTYRRTTLAVAEHRVTLDAEVRALDDLGRTATLADDVVIETKGTGAASVVDRTLWAMHLRPIPISKYAVGMAALHPALPANRWRRTLRRHVRVA